MTIRDRVISQFSRALIWRFGMAALSVASLMLVAILWLSGAHDTREAMTDGRRLLITLQNSAIEGKQISLDNTETPVASKAAPPVAIPTAAATAPAKNTVAESAPANAPNPESASKESPQAQAASEPASAVFTANNPFDQAQDTEIKPAAVPLAEVKDALLEKTATGNLPIIGPKNLMPWKYYAKPYFHKGNLPTIAIIVSGLGEGHAVTDAAIRLPENISLSFSPYARELVSWVHAARTAGHEILLDLPLEPSNFPASDPGPYGLLVGKGTQENTRRLHWLMSRAEGYIGFVSPLNESFSSNDAAFKYLLEKLGNRGLMLALAHEPAKNGTLKILNDSKTAYVIADTVIDEDLSVTGIQARLLALEQVASKRGFAVGRAQAFPLTIQQLNLWSAHLEKDGYTLVPVTFIAKLTFPPSS